MKKQTFHLGEKVKVKKGLGIISGKTGYIIKITNEKALINFPYYDIREIYLKDLEKV